MATSHASCSLPLNGSQPFPSPAFAVPHSQQSLLDYSPPLFAAAELDQQQELQRQVATAQAHSPSQALFQRPPTPLLCFNVNPKLPSLKSLIKKMQTDAPPTFTRPLPQRLRLRPVLLDLSLQRTVISQNTKKCVPCTTSGPQTSLLGVSSLSMQQLGSLMGPSFPVKRRSWSDTSPMQQVTNAANSHLWSTSSHTTHRSRASKYCKIEGCERVSQRNNLCHSHGGKRLCKEGGCSSKDRGNGYCIKHGGGKICSVLCCEKKARRKGLCTQHFRVSGACAV